MQTYKLISNTFPIKTSPHKGDIKGSVFARVFGNERFYRRFSEEDVKKIPDYLKMSDIMNMVKNEMPIKHSMNLIDSLMVVPTMIGRSNLS